MCERRKKENHMCLSHHHPRLALFVSLSRCCFFFALSSNTRSWEDKGKRNEMIFWTTGARDSLWDVVVKWDDICFKHILPRLNGTDIKFLYEVNSETRKLIERSSRARDLRYWFKVKEMSSISTLEVAWENKSLWSGDLYNKTYFAVKLLKRINSSCSSGCVRRKSVSGIGGRLIAAAEQDNMEMVKYCVANECPIDAWACAQAAGNGHLEVLKYLREEAKAPWDWRTASWAAGGGHLHILEYLVDRKYDEYDEEACEFAADGGHLDCLKYLHETAKAPWDSSLY